MPLGDALKQQVYFLDFNQLDLDHFTILTDFDLTLKSIASMSV